MVEISVSPVLEKQSRLWRGVRNRRCLKAGVGGNWMFVISTIEPEKAAEYLRKQ